MKSLALLALEAIVVGTLLVLVFMFVSRYMAPVPAVFVTLPVTAAEPTTVVPTVMLATISEPDVTVIPVAVASVYLSL
jgi:hypothetical protein